MTLLLLTIITYFLFVLTVSGTSLALKDVQHVGCFPDSRVKGQDYYEVRHLLTWQECLDFCHHRFTLYAGVQSEHRSSSDNNCFCGNNLPIWQPVEETTGAACRPCLDNTDRSCGGDHVMSVYNIRDSTPFTVFLATDVGIKMFSEDSAVVTTVANVPGTTSVEYIYDEEEVFFVSGIKLYRSFFNYLTMKYSSPGRIPLHNYVVLDFTVDWVQRSLFWMNGDSDYSIYQSDLQGGKATKVLQRNYFLRNLVIDPYARMLFFVEFENKLYSYSMKDGTLHNYYNGKIHVNKIKKMAVDVKNEVIYVVGAEEEGGELQLMSVDYGDTKARLVYQGPQLTDPAGLDVYNGEVVWTNHEDLKYSLYRCKLTPRCQPENIVVAYQSLEKINEITIYHPEKQTPGLKYLCSQLGCSHSCEAESLFAARCVCPQGMAIAQDKTTCLGNEDSTGKGYINALHRVSHDAALLEVHLEKHEDVNTETRLHDKRHTEAGSESVATNERTVTGGDQGGSQTDPNNMLGHFQFFVVFCFLSLFLLLSVVIYLQVRRGGDHVRAVTVGHRCRIAEPDEGANTYVEIHRMPGKINVPP